MQFFLNGEELNTLEGYIFCDNDFLGILYHNKILFKELSIKLEEKDLYIDSYTKLEFLKDVQLPKEIRLREEFLEDFTLAEDHFEIYKNTKDNALALSRLYAHNGRAKVSLVDLFLASRIIQSKYQAYLITGNTKDFPSFIFDIVSVINYEQKDGALRAISILKVNNQKLQDSYDNYKKLPQV
jgi:predicted nucleic acid-binding protein